MRLIRVRSSFTGSGRAGNFLVAHTILDKVLFVAVRERGSGPQYYDQSPVVALAREVSDYR